MNDLSDQQLLRDYAERKSEAAFAFIVQRYVDLVYSAAFRMLCDNHAAKDVTQSVFVALAQNARQLTDRPSLAGWLHSTARNLAAKTVRSEVRRRVREQEAAVMNDLLSDKPDTGWEHIAPHLDEALGELSETEREAVLLRYFKNHDLRTVGAALGISDDAAQKRVSRAVERLREFFAKRGVTVGASGLVVVISANAVQAAPAGLAFTISTAAALTGTTLVTTASLTAAKAIAMTAIQKTIITATVVVLAGAGIYEARQAAQMREQAQALQQQQGPLSEQIQQLQQERDDATNRLAGFLANNQQLSSSSDQDQILKLRGEVARLRAINLNSSGEKANDPFTRSVLALVSRAAELNQHLQQRPENRIPELQLLDEKDWLTAAQAAKFDTDADIRKALQKLRSIAKAKLPFGSALYAFASANSGDLPKDISQLKPYFDKSRLGDLGLDDSTFNSIAERYALLHAGNTKDFPSGTWFIVEKAPVDGNYDSRAKFGLGTSTVIATGSGEVGDPDDRSY